MLQVPPQNVKPGDNPKPFGHPIDITTLAVLSSLTQNNLVLGWFREVDKAIHFVILFYLICVDHI